MCGIAGIVSKQTQRPLHTYLDSMSKKLRHRGPDDEGFLLFSNNSISLSYGDDTPVVVKEFNSLYKPTSHIHTNSEPAQFGLVHRRLSILDLSPLGHQPQCLNDSEIYITFNGEIYNYIEIRNELREKGYTFTTESDTEVLLNAYKEWGIECLSHFNGMWSFVLYDTKKQQLFGARDRFGVKPLYYSSNEEYFVFASEPKAIVGLPFVSSAIHTDSLFDYLVYGLKDIQEQTFFQDIKEIRPSSYFIYNLSSNTFAVSQYYSLQTNLEWEKFSRERFLNHSKNIQELFFSAVDLRLRSDVTVGSALSGGLDSSAIVSTIRRLINIRNYNHVGVHQKVFTVTHPNLPINEQHWAEIVAKHTSAEMHTISPTSTTFKDDIEKLVYTQDIPFDSTAIYAQYMVMKLAKSHNVTVLLDGQGADEVFGGYQQYYRGFFAEMLKKLKIPRFLYEYENLDNSPVDAKFVQFSMAKLLRSKFLPTFLKSKTTRGYIKEFTYIQDDFWSSHSHRISEHSEMMYPTSLNEMLLNSMTRSGLLSLLRYEDRNSMSFSIESRTPFADDTPLIEYVFGISSSYKIVQGWSKALLRQSMIDIIPNENRLRKDKVAFATPEYTWLIENKEYLQSFFTATLSEYFNVQKLIQDWDSILQSQKKEGITMIWRFINVAIWMKVFAK